MGQANLPRSTRHASNRCHFFSTRRPHGVENVLRFNRWKVRAGGGPADRKHEACATVVNGRARYIRQALLAACIWILAFAPAWANDCLRPQDDFFLLNTRNLCSNWYHDAWQRLDCKRYVVLDAVPCRRWVDVPIEDFYLANNPSQLTLVYVHGNRVRPGEEIAETLQVYRAILRCLPHAPPIRLVAFSWPSERMAGPLRDYRLKAQLADPAALHLASVLAHVRSDMQLTLVGYSYGSRVIGGALHLLAGGTLRGHALPARVNLRPARVLLIAAAVDSDWLLPGRPHGMALHLVERMVLINNSCDPAMRFYHLSSRWRDPNALGQYGLRNPAWLGPASERIYEIDACCEVGRHHALEYYLGATRLMCVASQQVLPLETLPVTP